MPIDPAALLVVYKSLYLANETIGGLQAALNNSPLPCDALDLQDKLADMETEKDELIAMRDQLKSGALVLPPPDNGLMTTLQGLVVQVEKATQADALALAGTVLDTGIAVMGLPS